MHRPPHPTAVFPSAGPSAAPGSGAVVLPPALHKIISEPGFSSPTLSSMFLVSPN